MMISRSGEAAAPGRPRIQRSTAERGIALPQSSVLSTNADDNEDHSPIRTNNTATLAKPLSPPSTTKASNVGGSRLTGSTSRSPRSRQRWFSAVSSIKSRNSLLLATEEEGDDTPDPFGERLAQLWHRKSISAALARRTLRQQQQQQQQHAAANDAEPSFSFPPLLSQSNLQVAWRLLLRYFLLPVLQRIRPFLKQVPSVSRFLPNDEEGATQSAKKHQQHEDNESRLIFYQRNGRTSWRAAGENTLCVALFLLVVVLVVSHSAVVWSSQALWAVAVSALYLLFDAEQLGYVQRVFGYIPGQLYQGVLEDSYLQRRRFAGREWQKDEFLYHEQVCLHFPHPHSSQSKSLWELPPPSMQEGRKKCLSAAHLRRPEWSEDTVAHIVGMDYCYAMLREEHLMRQARKRQKQQQQQAASLQVQHEHISKGTPGLVKEELTVHPASSSASPPQRASFRTFLHKRLRHRGTSLLLRSPAQSETLSDTTSCTGGMDDSLQAASTASTTLSRLDRSGHRNHRRRKQQQQQQYLDHHQPVPSSATFSDHGLNEAIELKVDDAARTPRSKSLSWGDDYTPISRSSWSEKSFSYAEEDDDEDEEDDDHLNSEDRRKRRKSHKRQRSHHSHDDDDGASSSVASMNDTASDVDLPWIDVGAKIGMQLLNSAHVHRAMASTETTERIMESLDGGSESFHYSPQKKQSMPPPQTSLSSQSYSHPHHASTHHGTTTTTTAAMTFLPPLQVAGGGLQIQQAPSGQLAKPMHALWTSATAAAEEDEALPSPPATPEAVRPRRLTSPRSFGSSPPLTPTSNLSPNGSSVGAGGRLSLERIPENYESTSPALSPSHLALLTLPAMSGDGTTEVVSVSVPGTSTSSSLASSRSLSKSPVKRAVSEPGVGSKSPTTSRLRRSRSPHKKAAAPAIYCRRDPLAAGIKVAVPIFPYQPQPRKAGAPTTRSRKSVLPYQMGTVVSSKRVYVGENEQFYHSSNCLSVTVKLDKSFLRHGEFAELTFRVMDTWSDRYMPRHSKVPVGSCVATTFGLGVLVGWRVEDDCHVVRSLWQRRGPGASHAYLNRNAIHAVMEAAVGFRVHTKYGVGVVLAYVDGGRQFDKGRFFVALQEDGRHKGHVVELYRSDILSCHGAQFIPVIEHIREAAHFQIQVDNYEAAMRERSLDGSSDALTTSPKASNHSFWQTWSAWADILWASFLKAVEEDKDVIDEGWNELIHGIIVFLERLDEHHPSHHHQKVDEKKDEDDSSTHHGQFGELSTVVSEDFEVELVNPNETKHAHDEPETAAEPGLWLMDDIFGGVFNRSKQQQQPQAKVPSTTATGKHKSKKTDPAANRDKYYNRIFSVLRTLMRTISVARVASVEHPHLRLALAIVYDGLLFCRTFLKVQQRNVSVHSMEIWSRTMEETSSTFGPLKDRLQKIGKGIAQRMEKQGRRAKARLLKFADTLLGDERLLFALEQGDWDKCAVRLELALIKAKIVEKHNLVYYRKAAAFAVRHWKIVTSSSPQQPNDFGKGGATARNNEKLAVLAQFVQWIAAPRRSLLKLFERNDVLEFFERILVRVFHKQALASRMLVIHASNFHTLRHLRLLKDFSTSGRLWMPVLDAAQEELSWLVSQLPDNTQDLMRPLSDLFALGVAHIHKIDTDLTVDWMDFLMQEEAVRIIHEIDTKLILALESFARDVKDMMTVLPYYSSIDDDLLGLMDEVNVDEFLREASAAMEDPDKLNEFIREKATIAIERFLNYLPRMSIPVEKRELMEGWVLTCRGENGGDLTLSDVKVKRENLVCQILGGDALFFPMFGASSSANEDDDQLPHHHHSEYNAHPEPSSPPGLASSKSTPPPVAMEESVLDHIRELILQAQRHGCWKQGVGGIVQPPSDRYVASVLHHLPVSTVLNCGIELWRNLEIDDDELLEIAVRDVSYQIQLQKEREEPTKKPKRHDADDDSDPRTSSPNTAEDVTLTTSSSSASDQNQRRLHHNLPSSAPAGGGAVSLSSFDSNRKRFNPRVDPTVFFLEMRNLTLHLDKFLFRIEKSELYRTILDPVFDGKGSLLIQNVSIRLRVECAKERMRQTALGETFSPILVLRELTTSLGKVELRIKDTGFGSDWLVNKAVEAFSDDITKVVADNLRDQILEQVEKCLSNLNSYFLVNPNLLLNLLGISMEDLDDFIVWA